MLQLFNRLRLKISHLMLMLLNLLVNVSLFYSLMNLLVDNDVLLRDIRSSEVENLEFHEFDWVPHSSKEREAWFCLWMKASL